MRTRRRELLAGSLAVALLPLPAAAAAGKRPPRSGKTPGRLGGLGAVDLSAFYKPATVADGKRRR
jgi:hypothetical protein